MLSLRYWEGLSRDVAQYPTSKVRWRVDSVPVPDMEREHDSVPGTGTGTGAGSGTNGMREREFEPAHSGLDHGTQTAGKLSPSP
jgi:hypothetical protein